MIDKNFWEDVAREWEKDTDGISIPEISGVEIIDADISSFDEGLDDEIDDILADLGLDDE